MINWNYKINNQNINIKASHYYKVDEKWFPNAEPQTRDFFCSIVKDGFNIIDAGAQIGMYSLLFGVLNPNGNVYSFEPTDTINLLNENIKLNNLNNIHTHQIALSNKNGKFLDRIFKIWSQQIIEEDVFEFITLDKFIQDNNIKVDLIKIDVDSYDYEVLQGLEYTLKNQAPIIVVELNHALEKRGFNVNQPIKFMEENGYFCFNILDNENYIFKKLI